MHLPPGRPKARREAALARGEKPKYDGRCREPCLKPGPHTAVRFRGPDSGVTRWDDLIKGPIAIDNREFDDLVVLRADGLPTYNFPVVVDDITMRSLTSSGGKTTFPTPPGRSSSIRPWNRPPRFAHMPLLLAPDRAKLSSAGAPYPPWTTGSKAFCLRPEQLLGPPGLVPRRPGDLLPG